MAPEGMQSCGDAKGEFAEVGWGLVAPDADQGDSWPVRWAGVAPKGSRYVLVCACARVSLWSSLWLGGVSRVTLLFFTDGIKCEQM